MHVYACMYVYVSLESALLLCCYFHLGEEPVRRPVSILIEEPELAGTAPTATSFYTEHNVSKKYQQFQAEDH